MDEIVISGVKYISSKRAARTTGYVTDYIGQLVRGGKLSAVKVGRAWFVAERGLELIAKNPHMQLEAHREGSLPSPLSVRTIPGTVRAEVSFPKTWSEIRYEQDETPLLPTASTAYGISDNRETDVNPVFIRKVSTPTLRATPTSMSVDGVRVTVHEHKEQSGHSSLQVQLIQHVGVHQHNHSTGATFARLVVASLAASVLVFLVPIFL